MKNKLYHINILYKNNEYEEMKKHLDELNISELNNVNGYYSLLLKYYMHIMDTFNIEKIIFSDIELMKRDYLNYFKYCNDNMLDQNIELFINKIKNNNILLEKDIIFLLNNCKKLLKYLDGYYINISLKSNFLNLHILKKYNILQYKTEIINYYHNILKNYMVLDNILSNKDIVIDGGNIVYYNCKNNKPTYIYFEQIISNVMKIYKNPIIIIHKKHYKNLNKHFDIIKYKNNIFWTEYGVYDDHYIIYSMIKNQIPILSNDKMKDHIYSISKLFVKNNNISNYIKDNIITYNETIINNIPNYSNCIQYIDNMVIIPCHNNEFYYTTI